MICSVYHYLINCISMTSSWRKWIKNNGSLFWFCTLGISCSELVSFIFWRTMKKSSGGRGKGKSTKKSRVSSQNQSKIFFFFNEKIFFQDLIARKCNLNDSFLDLMEKYCEKPFRNESKLHPIRLWDFYNSIFFVITVVSTIGKFSLNNFFLAIIKFFFFGPRLW